MKDLLDLIVGLVTLALIAVLGVVGYVVVIAGVMLAVFSPVILIVWLVAR